MIATPHPKGERHPIRFLSVCSGIEAASQALIPLGGFKCVGVAEIEPHPCHVLAHRFGASRPINMPRPEDVPTRNADGSHRFPQAIAKDRRERAAAIKAVAKLPTEGKIPNYGDMSRFQEWPDADVDALCGGTPCQSFSVAGLRAGLADPRGNLMLTFGAIAARLRPRWLLWENVPGVLSSDGGRDFASFLGLITGRSIVPPPEGWQNSGIVPGIADAYGVAWRVLDAQHVRTRSKRRAVPQRRRRVFLVGYLGDWTRAAAVLFDAESLRRDPAPRREAGQRPAPTISARPTGGGGLGTDFDLDGGLICADAAPTLVANGNKTGGNRPPGTDGDTTTSLIALSSGQANAEIAHDHSPALTCLHEAPIVVQPVAPTLRGEGFDATDDGTGKGTPIIPVASPLTAGMAASANRMPHEQGALIPVAYPLPVAGTLSSNGDGPGKHGFGMGQQDWENGYAVPVIFDSKGSQVQTDESGAAPTLRAMTHADSHQNGGGQLAVAFDMRGREGGVMLEGPHETANIRAADGGSSRSYVAVAFSTEPHKPIGVRQGDSNGNATEADAGEILRGVRGALGEEAFSWWGLGILDMLQSPEILRSALHGRKLRPAPFTRRWVVDCALSRQEDRGAWAVQSLREAGGDGCASSGWEPSEQRAHELGAYLSELSQPGAQAERFMLDLWRASEGIGLLREALSAVQEARRPSCGEGQPAQTTWKVRRLTPDECEFLQGVPRGVTNIPWRGKAFSPDGNRYKELGNSWALNAIEWIGERMLIVDAWD